MAINFSHLPQTNPFALPAAGIHKFVITKAEMKQPKDTTKPPYLNMTLALTALTGQKLGNVFDKLYESSAPALLFKLQRFARALELPLEGEVELKDLCKLVVNRGGLVEIEHVQDSRYKDDPTKQQAQVKLYGSECYWRKDELPELTPSQDAAPVEGPDVPFDFDSADGDVPAAASSKY